MNIEKWIKDNTWRGHVDEAALRELLKAHAIVPREPSNEFCRNVSKQSCEYTSILQIKTLLKFIIKAAENG